MINLEAIIFRICEYYYVMSGMNDMEYDTLEKAFECVIKMVALKKGHDLEVDFREILESVFEKYSYITMEDDTIIFYLDGVNWLEELFPNGVSEADEMVSQIIACNDINNILDIDVPIEEFSYLFFLNASIMNLYSVLGIKEFNNKKRDTTIELLKQLNSKLESLLADLNDEEKERVMKCTLYFDYSYFIESDDIFANAWWNVILFPWEQQLNILNYAKIRDYLALSEEPITIDETQDEMLTLDEKDIISFIIYFMSILDKYIKSNPQCVVLKELMITKYLLVSLPELGNLQKSLFDNRDIDFDLFLGDFSNKDESFIEILKDKAMQCVLSLDYPDKTINKDNSLCRDIILSLLFIKCFLSLSKNESSKNEVLDEIKSFCFYKADEYKIVTDLIDSILFDDGYNLLLKP